MEDSHVMITPSPDEGFDAYFGLFDGHGGTRAADWARDNLFNVIQETPAFNERGEDGRRNVVKAIADGVVAADARFVAQSMSADSPSGEVHDGTTVCLALFVHRDLYVGNVGDSEAVLCRAGTALKLSETHNPRANPAEGERILAAGGRLYNRRLCHPQFNPAVMSLAVSRSLGDAGFKHAKYTKGKPSGLIAAPHVAHVRLEPSDAFVILACDGLWDVMSPDEAVRFVLERLPTTPVSAIAAEMVAWADANGSTDNISVFVVLFVWPETGQLSNESTSTIHIRSSSDHASSLSSPLAMHRLTSVSGESGDEDKNAASGAGATEGAMADADGGDGDESAEALHDANRRLESKLMLANSAMLAKDAELDALRAEVAELRRQLAERGGL